MLARKLFAAVVIQTTLFACLLFLPAGTLRWGRAWVLLALMLAGSVAVIGSLYPHHKALLAERLTPPFQKGQPLADKILLSLLLPAHIGAILFIPLDRFRFHLLPPPGIFVASLGLVLVAAGLWLMDRVFKTNAFASPVVKHQAERRQAVIDTGVYAVVRHPMYAGAALLFIGIPLWLGSYAGALLALIPTGLLALRAVLEERFLRSELRGYDAYMKKVRYRLIPFLW